MKKNIINTVGIFMAMLMLTALLPMSAKAQDGDPVKLKFLSDIGVMTNQTAVGSLDWLKDNNFTPINTDLNRGVGGSDYVYMGYKQTEDPFDAITDIIVVIGEEYSGEHNRTVFYNGRTYRAAKYSPSSKGGNLNRGKSGSADIYFYYTKDRANSGIHSGDMAAMIPTIIIDKKGGSNDSYARLVYPNGSSYSSADLNKDAGGKYIYLQKNFHVHQPYGEAGSDGLHHCECGVALGNSDNVPQKSEDGYYNIRNAGQLIWFSEFVNKSYENHEACARLINNIDMTGLDGALLPLGTGAEYGGTNNGEWGEAEGKGWSGTFDGNGCMISNFTLSTSKGTPTAFVGYGEKCTVKNLKLENVRLNNLYKKNGGVIYQDIKDCVAGVIACVFYNATITNCSVSGTVGNGENRVAAGIAMSQSGAVVDISNCVNRAAVMAKYMAAGIHVVSNSRVITYEKRSIRPQVKVNRCVNYGSVTADEGAYGIAFVPVEGCDNLNTGQVKTSGIMYRRIETMFCTDYLRDEAKLVNNLSIGEVEVCSVPKESSAKIINENNYVVVPDFGDLVSGKMCHTLNKSEEGPDAIWHQKLGTEKFPTPLDSPYNVYKYSRYSDDGNDKLTCYTNYGAYADDMNNAPCHYKTRSFELASADSTEARVTLQCVICNKKLENRIATLVSKQRVLARLCNSLSNIVRFTYSVGDENIIVTHDLETDYRDAPSFCQYTVHNEALGVDQCEKCGNINMETLEHYEIKDGIAMISKPGHLLYYAKMANMYYRIDGKLLNDIDLSGVMPYVALNSPYVFKDFWRNTFDGNGHTISGYANDSSNTVSSFFRKVEDGVIKNLTIEGSVKALQGASLLVNELKNSKIENCITRGSVYSENGMVAGLCRSVEKSDIEGCRNYAEVWGKKGSLAGGIVAMTAPLQSNNVNITRCANYGTVVGDTLVGGIIGSTATGVLVRDCANYGSVIAKTNVGGIMGDVKTSESGDNMSALYNMNVGRVILCAENDGKGTVCGDVSIKDEQHFELSSVYYLYGNHAVGTLTSGKLGTNNVMQATQQEFSDGTVCDALNMVDDKFFREFIPEYDQFISNNEDEEMAFVNSNKAVWGMESVDGVLYPSPFSNKKLYKLSFSDTKMYIIEGQELSKLNIVDGFYFNAPVAFTVDDLTYEAPDITVKKGKYATLRLPFNYSDPRLTILEYVGNNAENGEVYFNAVTEAQAEKNYLVRIADDCEEEELQLNIAMQNVGIAVSTADFPKFTSDIPDMETGYYGTYTTKMLNGSDGFYMLSADGDSFMSADAEEGSVLTPFRAVFKYKVEDPVHNKLIIVEGNTPSGIAAIERFSSSAPAAIYNVGGQRVSSLQRGINIIRTKDGKRYKVM